MDEYTKSIENIQLGGGDMKDDKGITLKEAIKLYYGEIDLTDTEKEEIDERLRKIEESGFLEKCKEIAREKERERERKIIHIGRLKISRVAGLIFLVCFISVFGVTAYAAVMSHIREIEVNEMGDHSEVAVEYNPENEEELSAIETYYKPVWVPDGYYLESEREYKEKYTITYAEEESDDIIDYKQYLPFINSYYGAEEGIHENISFGKYTGEYIDSDSTHYLIVTDGTYLYSIISEKIDKETMIKMLGN